MDILTHCLLGWLLARLVATPTLGRRRALWLALLCSNLPDVDFVTRLTSPLTWRLERCGLTHSVLFCVVGTLLAVAALRKARDATAPSPAPWLPTLWLGLLCALFHVGLDMLTPRGVPLGWPLYPRRIALDWLHPDDPLPALICMLALAAPLAGGRTKTAPVAGVMALGLYVGLVGASHGLAHKQALVMARKEGFDLDAAWAFPETPGGLFWNTVAANEAEVLQRPVDLLGPPRAGFRYYRGLEEPLVEDFLEETPLGRAWAARARVAVASSDHSGPTAPGYEVWVRDLAWFSRFETPQRVTPYDVRARFNDQAELQEATLFMPPQIPDEPPPFPVRARTPIPLATPPRPAGGR